MKWRWMAVVAAALVGGAASAQIIEDPEAVILEELVVRAKEPGPAWWRVSDADSTVYIIGVLEGPMPADIGWDRSVLEKRLKGAHSFLGGASMHAGLRDAPALIKLRSQLKSKTPLEETLDPQLRQRFVAARERAGKPARRYASWRPVVAGQLLLSDLNEKEGWRRVEPEIRAMAAKRRLKATSSARYEAMPFLRAAFASLTPSVERECMESALDDIEAPGRARRAAVGWATGDVETALTAPRSFDRCVLILAGGADLWRRASEDQAADIAKALDRPGKAVAAVNLRRLLADDGVIARLRARGLKVSGPGEA